MNPLEILLSTIAPHNCIVCGNSGDILCVACSLSELSVHPSRCYRCHKTSPQNKVCVNCRRKTGLNRVWALVSYDDVAKKLIYKLKYERAKSAAGDIARVMDEQLPLLPENTIVTHLPTASSRIRVRGYDQAQLVARSLAKRKHLACKQLLGRKGGSRQVGASRKSRFQQLQGVFRLKHDVAGAHVLLVDDVLTTGASIESAAKALKSGGAKKVEAVVFAQP